MLVLAIAVLSLGLLSSCSRAPTAYSAGIKKNFVKGCVSAYSGTGFAANKAAAGKVCGCVYDQAEHKMPFSDFKAVQDKLRKDHPKKLEDAGAPGEKLASYVLQCQKQVATQETGKTTGGQPTTTVPGATTTAPGSSTPAVPASSTTAAK